MNQVAQITPFMRERLSVMYWWAHLTEKEKMEVWSATDRKFSYHTFCKSDHEIHHAFLEREIPK